MKKTLLLTLLLSGMLGAAAQWSNTTNQFYDSLDMPVGVAANDQLNPLIVKSQPDGGYFVIWEDYRNNGTQAADIYAQKYDKQGKALWAVNGVPVASGSTHQQYSTSKNGNSSENDYRNVGHAASDGAGGFYIAYCDYVSLGSYDYSRVLVQHVRSNGSVVFGETGYVIGNPNSATTTEYSNAQLVGDGKGGFFIGYAQGPLQQSAGKMIVWMYCYKDEGGTLKRYGGGEMNLYTLQRSTPAGCGTMYYLESVSYSFATSFIIFPDLQDGCAVVMTEQVQNGTDNIVGYNRLVRVKKDCRTTVSRRLSDIVFPVTFTHDYKKDSVVTQYKYATFTNQVSCHPNPNRPDDIISYTNYFVEQGGQGLRQISNPLYAVASPNGKIISTDGNIDVCLITWNQRDYINNQLTNWVTRSATLAIEKYDSLPYELCSDIDHPYYAYRPEPVEGTSLNKLNVYTGGRVDTLINASNTSSRYGYTMAASGNRILLAATGFQLNASQYPVYYQELQVERVSADSFALQLKTGSQNGIVMGYGQSYVQFRNPQFATDGLGNALFYIADYHNYIRVSTVAEGGSLRWANMGLPISAGISNGRYTNPDGPFVYLDTDGTGVVSWFDARETPTGFSGNNVYVRHLDSLSITGYQPPIRQARSLSPGSASSIAVPQVMNGSSNAWTPIMTGVYTAGVGITDYSASVQIKDDYNLGTVSVQTYQNAAATRKTADGRPYLNRNYTISVTNHPAGATIYVRLIFTKAEFNALKAADPSIQTPGDLSVIKQSNPTGTVPATYSPVAGEQGIQPLAWAAIDTSGYYIELAITDFSNFFILKANAALPVILSYFTAEAVEKTALLEWKTTSEVNNDYFEVLRSSDGNVFSSIGRLNGNGTSNVAHSYRFVDANPLAGKNYYRLAQVDLDGKKTLSSVRQLDFNNPLPGKLMVAPNPASSVVTVNLPGAATTQDIVTLYDMSGRQVLQHVVPAGSQQLQLDISTLLQGTYLLAYGKEKVKIIKVGK